MRETGTETSCLIDAPSSFCASEAFSRSFQNSRACASDCEIAASSTKPSSNAFSRIDSSFAARSLSPLAVETSRSEEHTSELQSLMRISYAVFCLQKKKTNKNHIFYR